MLRTEINKPDEEEYNYWYNSGLRDRVFKVLFISEKGSFQKVLSVSPGVCKSSINTCRLSTGSLLIILCNRLFCLQDGECMEVEVGCKG